MSGPRLRKKHFIKALKEAPNDGRALSSLFAVSRKNLATSSRNKPYLRLTLADKSDTIDAFVWEDAAEYARQFTEGDIISAVFRLRVRNDVAQLHIDSLEKLSAKDLDGLRWEDFRPGLDGTTRKRIWEEIESILGGVTNQWLTKLLHELTSDLVFRGAFLDAAAAKEFHHAYVGGLAEHTLAVMKLAQIVGDLYRDRLNGELLLVGAFLHDVGKVEELSRHTGGYTDTGRLLGHIVLGAELVRDRVSRVVGFPASDLLQLEHLVLSHHGQRDWGSPVEPQTLEAIVLSFLDNLDAKLAGATEWLDKENVQEGAWSGYWRGLGRSLLRTPGAGRADSLEVGDPSMRDIEDQFLRSQGHAASANEAETPAGEAEQDEVQRTAGKNPKRSPPGQGKLF